FIYRTTNGGTTWTQVFTDAGFIDGIQMISATNGYAMGDPVLNAGVLKYVILRTTDGGATWARMTTEPVAPTGQFGWNNSFQVQGSNMWFGTNQTGLWRSTDLGVTWSFAATTAMTNSYAVWFNNSALGTCGGETGATQRSTNGGAAWAAAAVTSTAFVGGMAGVNNLSGQEFWASAGTGVYYTTNQGVTWSTAAPNGYSGTQTLNHVSMVRVLGTDRGWAVGNAGTIVRYNRTITGVADNPRELPTVFALDQNFPNPFNPTTTIRFALPEQATVSLKIYNLLGQEIATLAEGDMPAAFHNVVWNGRNNSGAQVATGMYFYRLEATGVSGDRFNSLKKLILLK
ncbi:MAG: FlgD immunoglobulin-like domain containing protein, partial [Bacteroidota bacterium]